MDETMTVYANASLPKRLASFVYEGVLLFGVLMITAYLYSSLTQQRHALHGRHGLQLFLFVVLGIYFVWFWSHGGQTVAMKTWRIRLVDHQGSVITQWRGLGRYLLSWLWVWPPFLWAFIGQAAGWQPVFVWICWCLFYAMSSLLLPGRQFLHDVLCGTRLIDTDRAFATKHIPSSL